MQFYYKSESTMSVLSADLCVEDLQPVLYEYKNYSRDEYMFHKGALYRDPETGEIIRGACRIFATS